MFIEIRQKVLFDYLERYRNTPSLTLARMLYRDEPRLFSSIDMARGCVRYWRGTNGECNRRKIEKRKNFMNV